jgi:hypothetical protein
VQHEAQAQEGADSLVSDGSPRMKGCPSIATSKKTRLNIICPLFKSTAPVNGGEALPIRFLLDHIAGIDPAKNTNYRPKNQHWIGAVQ